MSTTQPHSLPRIEFASAGLTLTPEEFDAITDYDDCYHYELIRGVLVVTPFGSPAEADADGELGYWLRLYRDRHPAGRTLDATLPGRYLHVPNGRRRADRVIWAGLGRLPDPDADVPTIAVDLVSESRRDWSRDYEEKRGEYLALGVAEYWIIDRFRRTMTVYRDPARGPAEEVVAEGETYRTPVLPGFELPLGQLLSKADDWSPKRPQ